MVSQLDADSLRSQLERILTSSVFARSGRMCRFLRFVVEESLRGGGPSLKESVIAVQVFDRGQDHDPAVDPVVRVEARRLRIKLDEYYTRIGVNDPIVIALPKGSYAPLFEERKGPSEPTKTPVKMALAAFAAAALVAVVSFAVFHSVTLIGAQSPSVAVLPLSDLSSDKSLGYFCDGLTDQLIFVLSHIDGLRVPGHTSSFSFRGANTDLRTIGANLKVDHIVEGSVRVAGDRLRITAQLIAVKTGYQLWSQTYERELGDIFAVQDEISQAVGNSLRVRVAPMAARKPTNDAEALRLYLQGRYHWYENDFPKSVEFFQKSIEKDPGFAMAYAGLGRAYSRIETGNDSFPKAESAARRALEIDETSAEAVTVLALINVREWDWLGAEREFQRALKLDPKFAEAHGEYAISCLAPTGRMEEALRESAKNLELDPLSPFANIRHGVLLMYARRFQAAESQLRNAYRLAPEYARRHLGKLYLVMGKHSEALELFAGEPTWRAVTLARTGRVQEAHRAFALTGDVNIALYWDALGDRNRAFETLEKGYESHALGLTTLASPVWDPLRSDDRFQALLRRIGLNGRS